MIANPNWCQGIFLEALAKLGKKVMDPEGSCTGTPRCHPSTERVRLVVGCGRAESPEKYMLICMKLYMMW